MDFVSEKKLFTSEDTILVSVSGGIDSVVMAHLFSQSGFRFGIIHCNFRLRGRESDGDESFVKELAGRFGVPLFCRSFETHHFAKQEGISVQMAARKIRYTWFEEVMREQGFSCLATGHHLDDQAETFLINLFRGTGIAGLHGILPKMDWIVRPLLFADRGDIQEYARQNDIRYREDSSNIHLDYQRNRIRHLLLPVLNEIRPGFSHVTAANVHRIREAESLLLRELERMKSLFVHESEGVLKVSMVSLYGLAGAETFLHHILNPLGFGDPTIRSMLAGPGLKTGKQFRSATHRAIIDRQVLIVHPLKDHEPDDEEYTFESTAPLFTGPVSLIADRISNHRDFIFPDDPDIAFLDFDKLEPVLTIRRWKDGDHFIPLGMKGKKKLSDFFIDEKFSLLMKRNTWLLLSGTEIVWIIGHRIDHRYRVTHRSKTILRLTFLPETEFRTGG